MTPAARKKAHRALDLLLDVLEETLAGPAQVEAPAPAPTSVDRARIRRTLERKGFETTKGRR